MIHPAIQDVTARIIKRSKKSRAGYMAACKAQMREGPRRKRLSEGNVAHASAGCAVLEKTELLGATWPNIGIVTAYNDMLSAHSPFERFPELIRHAAPSSSVFSRTAHPADACATLPSDRRLRLGPSRICALHAAR